MFPMSNRSPKPGQGMDPMAAMMGGFMGPQSFPGSPAPQPNPLAGPNGLPLGGSPPPPGTDPNGSALLAALMGSAQEGQNQPMMDGGPQDMDLQSLLGLLSMMQQQGGQGGPTGHPGNLMG